MQDSMWQLYSPCFNPYFNGYSTLTLGNAHGLDKMNGFQSLF